MTRRLKVLTNSATKKHRGCARAYQLAYELLIRPRATAAPLRFGTIWHHGLESWWHPDAVDRLADAFLVLSEETKGDDVDPFEVVILEELLRGYHYRWCFEPIKALAVEGQFIMPLVNPETGASSRTFEFAGKIDAIVELEDGSQWLMEHKTSSDDIRQGSPYWQTLQLDTQISTYYEAAQRIGYNVAGVIYDVVKKPQIKPLKATPEDKRKYKKNGELYASQRLEDETPEEFRARLRDDIAADPDRYYQRGKVVRFAKEERDAAYDRWHSAIAIRDAQRLDVWPRNPDHCFRWHRPCEYWAICTGETDEQDMIRYRVAERAHEELEIEIKEEVNNDNSDSESDEWVIPTDEPANDPARTY